MMCERYYKKFNDLISEYILYDYENFVTEMRKAWESKLFYYKEEIKKLKDHPFSWSSKLKTELLPEMLAYIFVTWSLLKRKSATNINFDNQKCKLKRLSCL